MKLIIALYIILDTKFKILDTLLMTGRTHDLAAFTALAFVVAFQPLSKVTLGTAMIALGSNLVGGIAPDIDQPTAKLWRDAGIGRGLARLLTPLLGGHRFISHSLIGVALFGFLANIVLKFLSTIIIFDPNVAWWAFMIGFVSHLFMDLFTEEGIPLFFPIPIKIGVPPLRFLRIKTGGVVENSFVFPGLLLLNVYLFSTHYHTFINFLKHKIN